MEDLAEEVQSWVDSACVLPPIAFEAKGVSVEAFDLWCGTQAEMAAKLNDYRVNEKPGCYIEGEGDCFDLVNSHADLGPYFAEWAAAEDLNFISTGPSGVCPNKRELKLDAGPDCVETVEQECDKIGTQCVCETKSAVVTCDTTPRP